MSKVLSYYHIVFCTKRREKTIPMEFRDDLYRFIWKEITSLNCKLLRIGGVTNHIHLLVSLHPSVALSSLVQKIKGNSSGWMQQDDRFKNFRGWAREYFASTISENDKRAVIDYIKNQEAHHSTIDLDLEFRRLYHWAGLEYDERDMF